MDQELAVAAAYAPGTRCMPVDSPDCVTLMGEMTSWPQFWTYDVTSVSVNRCVFTWRTILPKFHSDPIWNTGALGFFREVRYNKTKKTNKKNNTMIWDRFLI